MTTIHAPEHIDTIVVGGGQAGLAIGYHLSRERRPFAILDANERVGDAWRQRWDSLRLFTPAAFNGLVGMPFPRPARTFITKDEMADYLESYAAQFDLPVRTGVKVDRLWRDGDEFRLSAGQRQFSANNVIVAMANYQQPHTPAFATRLAPEITQLHSRDYRNPAQLQDGGVLVVGSGNSGAEIAIEVARTHPTWISGRAPGVVPFSVDGRGPNWLLARLMLGVVFQHVLTVDTPIGRRTRARNFRNATPLVRVKPRDLAAAGVRSVARTVGVEEGQPLLDDGQVLPVTNVIWCTGFRSGFEWIDLPVLGEHEPLHERGIVPSQPGLYFVGLHFEYALSSSMVQGVSRDAARIVQAVVKGRPAARPTATVAPSAYTRSAVAR